MSEYINILERFEDYKKQISDALNTVDPIRLRRLFDMLVEAIKMDRQIFVFGNGGSAAIAEHFATDFFKGVSTNTWVFPKINCLNTNIGLITAIGNDIGYEHIFEYQLQTMLKKDDVVIAISSSGNSPNILAALRVAETMEAKTVAITGFDWDNGANWIVDIPIHIDVRNYGVHEDCAQIVMHTLSQSLRKQFALNQEDIESFTF